MRELIFHLVVRLFPIFGTTFVRSLTRFRWHTFKELLSKLSGYILTPLLVFGTAAKAKLHAPLIHPSFDLFVASSALCPIFYWAGKHSLEEASMRFETFKYELEKFPTSLLYFPFVSAYLLR